MRNIISRRTRRLDYAFIVYDMLLPPGTIPKILKDRTKHHNLKIQGHVYSLTVLFILNLDFFGFLSVLDLNSEILKVGGLTML